MRKNYKMMMLTAVDNNGEELTMSARDWAKHPDTYSKTKEDGTKMKMRADVIRWRDRKRNLRGYTDRQVVGLDEIVYLQGGGTNKGEKQREQKLFDLRSQFLRGRLI